MKMKEESEKVGLKLNIQKTKIMASSAISSWKIDEKKKWKLRQTLFSWAPESLQIVTVDMKLKDACSLEEMKVWKWKPLSYVQLFASPWTMQSMEYSRPEYWSGSLFPSPGDLPNPGTEPRSPALQVDSLPSEPTRLTYFALIGEN